jgi:antitoxin MazE
MQATIQKWGNSQGIRIPKAFLEALNITENDMVELTLVGDKIVITNVNINKELTLSDIFEGYEEKLKSDEFDWGSPVGKEVGYV